MLTLPLMINSFLGSEESDRGEEEEWEKQQIRKGVTGAQVLTNNFNVALVITVLRTVFAESKCHR